MKKFCLLVLAQWWAFAAVAEDLSPGLWEITLESRVAANALDPGWTPAPFTLSHCLKGSDAKDPSRLISAIAVPGATDCSYTERSYAGSTFRFALECPGSLGLKTRGSVTFSADSFSGGMTALANVAGQATEMQNRVAGKRIGGC
ncbi:MAG: DUF3617 family protein [Betaproteobacteria bacterium]|nr:DUF3617 family protein [Betaproteobacteria bacterium]